MTIFLTRRNIVAILKKQQKPKTTEEQINEGLSGDTQKNALDFVAFLRAND